jgi:hypothetical protein
MRMGGFLESIEAVSMLLDRRIKLRLCDFLCDRAHARALTMATNRASFLR